VITLRVILAIARADFFERVRRNSYLVTLLFAVYLGYGAGTGQITMRLGDYRGLYTSAWIGIMMSLVTTTFVSLVGFYIVKNAVERDRRTGVGEILAATPISKPVYLVGKFLSNFAVLSSVVVILAIGAIAMQFLAAEDRTFHWAALLLPFLGLTLPAMAVTAAFAVFFESFRILRGGFGNIVWFFSWTFGVGIAAITNHPYLDPLGLWISYQSLAPAARAAIPGYVDSFSLTIGDRAAKIATNFHWDGLDWTPQLILVRLAWFAVAFAFVFVAAVFFDRFDPASTRAAKSQPVAPQPTAAAASDSPLVQSAAPHLAHVRDAHVLLSPLAAAASSSAFGRIFVAEVRLALQGLRWWWYAIAAVLLIAQLASPLAVGRGALLGVAWIWPVLIWSALGNREARFGATQLVFSCPRILARQFPASWLAGVFVAMLTGLGAAIRLAIAGEQAGVLAWFVAALFIPSLALALGTWSGGGKFFEALYVVLWYVGPMNHVPGLDYTGSASGPSALRYALVYIVLTAALLAAAFARRAHQLRGA
jgi:ABC-2 family transporter protein